MTNKRIIGLVAILLLLSMSSVVAFDWDNVGEYDPDDGDYGSYTIVDAFGLGADIATYRLLNNSRYCFNNCSATGVLELYKDYELITNFYYTDGERILDADPGFTYYIWEDQRVTQIVETPVRVCDERVEDNGSRSCWVEIQRENVTVVESVRVPYNWTKLRAGTYEWQIDGDKSRFFKADWIMEAMGVTMDEWAWWENWNFRQPIYANMTGTGEDLTFYVNGSYIDPVDGGHLFGNRTCFINASIPTTDGVVGYVYYNDSTSFGFTDAIGENEVSYFCESYTTGSSSQSASLAPLWQNGNGVWNMEDGAATTLESLVSGADLTKNGNPADTAGVWGRGIDFDGTGDFYTGTHTCPSGGSDFTYTTWINLDGTASGQRVYSCSNSGNNDEGFSLIASGTAITCFYRNSGGTAKQAHYNAFNSDTTNWQNIVCRYDSGADNLTIWANGTVQGSITVGGGMSLGATTKIGQIAHGGATDYDGKMEELHMFTDAKSDDWIKRQYEYERSRLGSKEQEAVSNLPEINDIALNTTSSLNLTNGTIQLSFTTNFTDFTIQTWYVNDVINTTFTNLTIIGSGNTTKGDNFTVTISAWNATAGNITNATRSVIINNAAPTTPTILPDAHNTTWLSPFNLSCSGSTDLDGDPINYEFWINLTNLALQQNTTLTTYAYQFADGNGTYNWNCQANDAEEVSGFPGNNITIHYNTTVILNNESASPGGTQSGQNGTFVLNITTNPIRVDRRSAIFVSRGQSWSVTSTNVTVNKSEFTAQVPLILNATDYTLYSYFNVSTNYTNGSSSTWRYEFFDNILATNINADCTGSNDSVWAIVNFTLRDEVNRSTLNGDIDTTFFVWTTSQTQADNISTTITKTNVTQMFVCLPALTAGYSYQAYAQTRYERDAYDPREHYFIDQEFTNDTDEVDLHLLEIDVASGIGMNVLDELENGLQGFYIEAQRYDLGLDLYYLVAMGRTDENGKDNIYLRGGSQDLGDTFYRFIIKNDTTIAFISDPKKITTSELFFRISSNPFLDQLETIGEMDFVLQWENSTSTFTLTYSGADSEIDNTCLKVDLMTQKNVTQDNICDTCSASASGTILCNVGNDTGIFAATAYVETGETTVVAKTLTVVRGVLGDFFRNLSTEGLFFTLIVFAVLVFSGMAHPIAPLILAPIALIAMAILQIFSFTYVPILILGIVIALIIARMKQ